MPEYERIELEKKILADQSIQTSSNGKNTEKEKESSIISASIINKKEKQNIQVEKKSEDSKESKTL